MKSNEVKKIAVAAMLTAVSVLICMLASLFSTMSLSITAVAGIASGLALVSCGYKYAMLVYIASAVLVWILVPDKQCALYYTVLFGHYPMLKLFTERIKNKIAVWIVKLSEACAVFVIIHLALVYILGVGDNVGITETALTAILFIVVYILYDLCIERLIYFFASKIFKR